MVNNNSYVIERKTVLYVVSHSYPFTYNGYSVRTHGIAKGLIANDYDVVVVNRPGRPWDLGNVSLDYVQELDQVVDGVRYIYLPYPLRKVTTDYNVWLPKAAEALYQLLSILKPQFVLAASNWETAEVALIVARQAKLPFYYEVRGFWEFSRLSSDPEWRNSAEFKLIYQKETNVALQAHKVFTLNNAMKKELVNRGVGADCIELVPNGCSSLPLILPNIKKQPRSFCVGYIGSFNEYEGLTLLIEALALLRKEKLPIHLHFLGSSNANNTLNLEQDYLKLAALLHVSDYLTISPPVANDKIGVFYQEVDIIVNPRLTHKVTELVSALKPIEAAAFGKLTLLSSVAPNRELADQSDIFKLFEANNVLSLKEQIKICYEQPELLRAAEVEGPAWVKANRLFSNLTSRFVDVFERN